MHEFSVMNLLASAVPLFTADAPAFWRDLFTAACVAACLTHHLGLTLWLRFVRGEPLLRKRGAVRRVAGWTWWLNAALFAGSAGAVLAGAAWPFLILPPGHRWNALLSMGGVMLLASGTFMFLWARQAMAEYFAMRALVYDSHPLLTHGPFAVSRHPIYTGVLMMALGALMLHRHAAALWLALWLLMLLHVKARAEERLLRQHFGEAYGAYAASTPRFFPFFIIPPKRR